MRKKINLFVVDDEAGFRELMVKVIPKTKYDLEVFSNGREVLEAIGKREFDVGLIDIKMPDMNGIELLRKFRTQNILTEFVILTGQASVATAIESMKLGCYDYLTKPTRLDELEAVIEKAYEKKVIKKENIILKEELQLKDEYCEMIGKSTKMESIFSLINKVAKTSSPILIIGESGTGKELVAKAIHRNSHRKDKPFIVVDCASLSENLLENELFGHEKGAFTDASSMKRGLFEIANGGVLFTDEIGEMKLTTQAKLLRAIETHQFRRLGGTKQIRVDVRIIAATNRNLVEEAKNENFRKDLYYRLNVVTINLPPLRERKEDIPLLVKHFMANSQVTTTKKKVSQEFMKILMEYDWPGNVRELANVMERALIISTDEYITPADLPIDFSRPPAGYPYSSDKMGLSKLLKDFERNAIVRALRECKGNKIETAKSLKLSRSKLYRKLKEYHIM
ncbi:MAG: sigma-54 dependent transcriptional regulator [candidate division WOR-3 bacterium]|nr:sigma-54 dependent transcriptional regulator [candidate division WOR-3 bacterium]